MDETPEELEQIRREAEQIDVHQYKKRFRFLKAVTLPEGTPYAVLTTEAAPRPDTKTGRLPTDEELARHQRVRPIINEILEGKGLVKVAEDKVHVTGLKGPLEAGWHQTVRAFVDEICAATGEVRSLSKVV